MSARQKAAETKLAKEEKASNAAPYGKETDLAPVTKRARRDTTKGDEADVSPVLPIWLLIYAALISELVAASCAQDTRKSETETTDVADDSVQNMLNPATKADAEEGPASKKPSLEDEDRPRGSLRSGNKRGFFKYGEGRSLSGGEGK